MREIIINIEKQVASLELCKKLKEIGVDQDGYFCWFKQKHHTIVWQLSEFWMIENEEKFDIISAFTVPELGELLGNNVASGKDFGGGLFCGCVKTDDWIVFDGDTEANARAKMLIYILENNLNDHI
jgi:hypothetical protein